MQCYLCLLSDGFALVLPVMRWVCFGMPVCHTIRCVHLGMPVVRCVSWDGSVLACLTVIPWDAPVLACLSWDSVLACLSWDSVVACLSVLVCLLWDVSVLNHWPLVSCVFTSTCLSTCLWWDKPVLAYPSLVQCLPFLASVSVVSCMSVWAYLAVVRFLGLGKLVAGRVLVFKIGVLFTMPEITYCSCVCSEGKQLQLVRHFSVFSVPTCMYINLENSVRSMSRHAFLFSYYDRLLLFFLLFFFLFFLSSLSPSLWNMSLL